MEVDTTGVESRIRSTHEETLAGVAACAADVEAGWDGSSTTDPAIIRRELTTALRSRGVMGLLPNVLETAIDTVGYELPTDPVPAPPYVSVTSVGPVLRGTVEDGRMVITMGVFRVSSEDRRRYVRASEDRPLAVDWVETAPPNGST